MPTTCVRAPTSRVRFGLARIEITPPVGIYHRLWGAARHDRATGVHRPLYGDVMVFEPAADGRPTTNDRLIRVQLDLCALVQSQQEALARGIAEAGGVAREQVVVTHSHTHSSGWFLPDRFSLPGGELIPAYLEQLGERMRQACGEAVAGVQEAWITYATGQCSMAANRDYWDEAYGGYACGANPDAPADETVLTARVTDLSGRPVASVVNYGCHPTTLAWENSLISPDFIGGMREAVEGITAAPCVYLQGACGDLGPRDGFLGDTAVADRNGRQLAYAALSALESMGPPATDFAYQGPVISGATLGTWAHVPFAAERLRAASQFGSSTHTVDLPVKPRPSPPDLRAELEQWEVRQKEADARGDAKAARDCGARAERARRWLARLAEVPQGATYPLRYTIQRLGDALWVTCGGEPYSAIQVELRRRFPDRAIFFSPLEGDLQVAYMLPADRYGKGLYQEEPSSLGPGCLEELTEAVARSIAAYD